MTEIGRELAQARERAGLSLETLSRRTKISVPILESIERGQIRGLPGGLYTRGLLRAYAREVGCDAEAIVRRFREACEPKQTDAGETLQQITAAAERGKASRTPPPDVADAEGRRTWGQLVALTLSLACGSVLYMAFGAYPHVSRSPAATHEQPAALATLADTAPSPPPAAEPAAGSPAPTTGVNAANADPPATPSTSTAPVTPTTPIPGAALHLDLSPSAPCWVSGTADGTRVTYQLFDSGDHVQIDAQQDVVLRIGDPAALTLTINGETARPLGTAGEPVTIHLTPQNYRDFVSR